MAELDRDELLAEVRETNRLLQQQLELTTVVAIQALRAYDLLLLLNLGISGDANFSTERILEALSVHGGGGYLGPDPAIIPEEDK